MSPPSTSYAFGPKYYLMTNDGLLAVFMDARAALARFLVVRGAQFAEAEDLLQDMYVKLVQQKTGPVAEPRAYLYRTAHNLFLDRHRAAARRHRREEDWSDTRLGQIPDQDTTPSIETILIDRERLKAVTDAIATLPERSIDIFRRYRIDGQSQKAIAIDLGLSVSAVEKHLQRAYRVVLDARQRLDAESEMPQRLGARGNFGDC